MTNNSILQAEQRVKEMNRMAQQYAERGSRFMQQMQNNSIRQEQPRFEPVHKSNANNRPVQSNRQNHSPLPPAVSSEPHGQISRKTIQSNFSNIKLDNEKLMILLIMYLLIKDKADIKLILALGYLLL